MDSGRDLKEIGEMTREASPRCKKVNPGGALDSGEGLCRQGPVRLPPNGKERNPGGGALDSGKGRRGRLEHVRLDYLFWADNLYLIARGHEELNRM